MNRPPRPPQPFGKSPFPPKPPFGSPRPFGPPKAFKPKPVNPKPRPAGKDYAVEAELLCRTISSRLLDEHIVRLKKQLEIAEAIRAERKVVEVKFQDMPLAELEAFIAKGVPGWELGVAQVVLNARKPKPAGEKKKTMPPKPPRRSPPPRPAGPGRPPMRNNNG